MVPSSNDGQTSQRNHLSLSPSLFPVKERRLKQTPLANKTNKNMKQLLSIPLLFATADALSMADPSKARSFAPVTDFKGGAGVGRLVLDGDGTPSLEQWSCKYDMVLVERLQGRPPADSGLFVPRENLPKLHLCRGELASLSSVRGH